MNLKGLLEYQKIEAEMAALNRKFNDEPVVKNYKLLSKRVKDAGVDLDRANADSQEMISIIQSLSDRYQEAMRQLVENQGNLDHIEDEKEADFYIKNVEKLIAVLNALANDIAQANKRVEEIKKQYTNAYTTQQDGLNKARGLSEEYKRVSDSYKPAIIELQKRQRVAQEGIAAEDMKRYMNLRNSGVKNPLVMVRGNSCGGCFMQVDDSNLSDLDREGYVICPNCGRILYKE